MKRLIIYILSIIYLYTFMACDDSTDNKDRPGLQGIVYGAHTLQTLTNQDIYLFLNNVLLAEIKTDLDGMYKVENIDYSGPFDILCSALNYRDTIVTVNLNEGNVSKKDFYLTPDNATGTLRGELQYDSLFTLDPSLESLTDQEIHDGVTGATLQSEWTDPNALFPPFIMMGNDTLWPPVDTYGRFRINLPIGTYPLTAIAQGFNPISRVKKIYADSTVYISFNLGKE